ncbi:hypothetical protein TWF788_001606 [Orbilia oligospora]|uniref:TNFR-Cys domain-containing protein n=1 Tax=Orbilia oligospora TaxID=2813651 RepID=A0A7C8K471_ORBOL|nr:hypothetical protein TWF788_001606 [Orbilia oligospora]
MKSSVFVLAIHAILVASQADPAAWAKYDHCPTTPSAGCAYICISVGNDPFCAANDPLTPRVYCNACPTTGDSCPAIFDRNCSYLCADGSYPDMRRCTRELPEGAQNVLCAGCAGAPGVAGYGTTAIGTTTVTVTATTISTYVSKDVSIVHVVSKEVSTVTATVSGTGGSGYTASTADTDAPSATTSGIYETTISTATIPTLPVPPVLPTYSPSGNGTSGNGTSTIGLPHPTYISESSRMIISSGASSIIGFLGLLGIISGWYI